MQLKKTETKKKNPKRTKELDNYIKKMDKQKSQNFFCKVLVILLGSLGLFYVLSNNFGLETITETDRIQQEYKPYPKFTAAKVAAPAAKATKDHLEIIGELEAYTYVTFTISSYDQRAKYLLDLGNGTTIPMHSSSLEYTYEHPGNYNVKLYGEFQGTKKKLSDKQLVIKNLTEIAAEAYEEN